MTVAHGHCVNVQNNFLAKTVYDQNLLYVGSK